MDTTIIIEAIAVPSGNCLGTSIDCEATYSAITKAVRDWVEQREADNNEHIRILSAELVDLGFIERNEQGDKWYARPQNYKRPEYLKYNFNSAVSHLLQIHQIDELQRQNDELQRRNLGLNY